MVFTLEQKKCLAIITKCTASLSIMGSAWIVQEIIRDKTKRSKVYHRLLLAMSTSDIINSATLFIGNWAIPAGTEGVYEPKGNELTCTIQGFFVQLGIITPLYNACLSVYYLLLINYNWREQHLRKIEPYFHCSALLWGFGTAITLLCLDQYHNANLWCFIASTDQTTLFRWALFLGPIWLVIFLVTIIMLLIYRHIYKNERTRDKYDFAIQQQANAGTPADTGTSSINVSAQIDKHRKYSRRFAKQSALYVLAFYLSFVFATTTRLIQAVNGKVYYPIILLFAIFTPMQGFFNFLVYKKTSITKFSARNSGRVFGRMASSFQALPMRRQSFQSGEMVAEKTSSSHAATTVREASPTVEIDMKQNNLTQAAENTTSVTVPATSPRKEQDCDFDNCDTATYSA